MSNRHKRIKVYCTLHESERCYTICCSSTLIEPTHAYISTTWKGEETKIVPLTPSSVAIKIYVCVAEGDRWEEQKQEPFHFCWCWCCKYKLLEKLLFSSKWFWDCQKTIEVNFVLILFFFYVNSNMFFSFKMVEKVKQATECEADSIDEDLPELTSLEELSDARPSALHVYQSDEDNQCYGCTDKATNT